MPVKRVASFIEELKVPSKTAEPILGLAEQYSEKSRGMMHVEDLKALGAALVYHQPKKMFEIGTFRGNTSDFCLTLLPELEVVSIAHVAPRLIGKSYNNSHKDKDEVGADVRPENRPRFTQLYGDSHALKGSELCQRFGKFDFVLVDGDHSAKGVAQDTSLALEILDPERAAICWHDANPKEKYRDVQLYLENQLPANAIATTETFIGGIAFWSGSTSEFGRRN